MDQRALQQPLRPDTKYVVVEGFGLDKGDDVVNSAAHYILTDSVRIQLRHLARACAVRRYPLLLQVFTTVCSVSLLSPFVASCPLHFFSYCAHSRSHCCFQGPTSAGKTSIVEYVAKLTGHRFVRINNHEHTDLQEYFGGYATDATGKLVFQDGLLVEAVRKVG